MRIIKILRSGKKELMLDSLENIKMDTNEADSLFGGYKEFKPPIYENEPADSDDFQIIDLLKSTSNVSKS